MKKKLLILCLVPLIVSTQLCAMLTSITIQQSIAAKKTRLQKLEEALKRCNSQKINTIREQAVIASNIKKPITKNIDESENSLLTIALNNHRLSLVYAALTKHINLLDTHIYQKEQEKEQLKNEIKQLLEN